MHMSHNLFHLISIIPQLTYCIHAAHERTKDLKKRVEDAQSEANLRRLQQESVEKKQMEERERGELARAVMEAAKNELIDVKGQEKIMRFLHLSLDLLHMEFVLCGAQRGFSQ